jgi:hypothetical protein
MTVSNCKLIELLPQDLTRLTLQASSSKTLSSSTLAKAQRERTKQLFHVFGLSAQTDEALAQYSGRCRVQAGPTPLYTTAVTNCDSSENDQPEVPVKNYTKKLVKILKIVSMVI